MRAHLRAHVILDERHDITFAPSVHTNQGRASGEPFAEVDLVEGLSLSAADPAMLDRAAEAFADAARQLRQQLAERDDQAGVQ